MVEKPAGVFSVPAKGAETDPAKADCVVSRVQHQLPSATGPLCVHRLDMETSGLMVVGLTKPAHRALSRQFQHRRVSKAYSALLAGHVTHEAGAIDLPIIVHWENRPRQIIDFAVGKPSRTLFSVLDRTEMAINEATIPVTRVRFHPLTGRSHQLRLHAAAPAIVNPEQYMFYKPEALKNPTLRTKHPYVGATLDTHCPRHLRNAETLAGGLNCPIVGDSLYSTSDIARGASRMMLHASRLAFFHPVTGERITIVSEPPF